MLENVLVHQGKRSEPQGFVNRWCLTLKDKLVNLWKAGNQLFPPKDLCQVGSALPVLSLSHCCCFAGDSRSFRHHIQFHVHNRLHVPPPPLHKCMLCRMWALEECHHKTWRRWWWWGEGWRLLSSNLNQNMIWHSLSHCGFLSLNEPGLWSGLCRFRSQVV